MPGLKSPNTLIAMQLNANLKTIATNNEIGQSATTIEASNDHNLTL